MDITDEAKARILQETDRYLAELASQVGEPSPKQVAQAKALVRSLRESMSTNSPE